MTPDAYDYVIVGAGSAGCVLAHRLTADGRQRVLLLEAGGSDRHPLVTMPLGFAFLLNNPKYDWCFTGAPEPALAGRRLDCPRGRVLGGSSSINAMLYTRGLAEDYDAWGVPGWDWNAIEPYFRKLEDYAGPGDVARGRGGPVGVQPNPSFHALSERTLAAAAQAGVGRCDDYNAPERRGVGHAQLYLRNARRCGSAAAYLSPARKRPNLTVITDALVEKIEFEGRRASGVCYRQGGRLLRVSARREVILSAGAIGTPPLLERSGVGRAEHVRSLGLPVIHDAPAVGEHLQDHYLVFTALGLKNCGSLAQELSGWRAGLNLLRLLLMRRGHMAGTATQVTGHAAVDVEGRQIGVQLIGAPLLFTRDPVRKTMVLAPGAAVMLGANVGRPLSRGSVHASGPEAADAPAILANFLAHPQDRAATVAAVRLCQHVLRAPAFDDIRDRELLPDSRETGDDALLDYCKASGASAYHPVGSCRMGDDPAKSVVDSRLRVHGLDGLRIVDASVMPAIVSANTHAPTVAIAERAAELILRDA